jgi:hypothetical protein
LGSHWLRKAGGVLLLLQACGQTATMEDVATVDDNEVLLPACRKDLLDLHGLCDSTSDLSSQ